MSKEAGISALRELNSEYPETPSRNKLEILISKLESL